MKRIILTVAAIFAFGFVNAQDAGSNGFAKGDMFVEGAIMYRSSDKGGGNEEKSYYSITPRVGYLTSDKLAFGGFLDFSGSSQFDNDKFNTLGIGAFARYYFMSLGANKAFNAYGEFGLGYSSVTNTDGNTGNETTDGDLNANIDLGLNYFFTKKLAVTFVLANVLSYNNSNPENGDASNKVEVNINLFNNFFDQPQFGLLYRW
ncbi:MAG: outer membrane beta-barrel protein [Flavobacterium sp.]